MADSPSQASLPVRFGVARTKLARATPWLCAIVSVATLVMAMVPALAHAVGAWGFLPVAAAWLAWLTHGGRPRMRDGEIALVDGRPVIRGAGRAPVTLERDAVLGGAIVPRNGFDLEIELRDGRTVIVESDTLAGAERALLALGVDAERHRSRVTLVEGNEARERSIAWLMCVPPAVLALALGNMPAGVVAVFVALFAGPNVVRFMKHAHRETSATIGLDGLEIRRGREARFIPFDDIADAHLTKAGVELEDENGDRALVLPRARLPEERLRAVARRTREALEVRRARGGAAPAEALARGGRSIADWRAALRALRSPGYRAAAPTHDELAGVLDDPTAPAERRLGAALALADSGDPAARERLAAAAETCARPRLRIALSAIAATSPDDEAIEEALAEEQAAETGRRRRA